MIRYTSVLLLLTFLFELRGEAQTSLLRPSVHRITNKLKGESVLHLGAPVGFAGIPETNNKYYKLYSKLREKATGEELLELTKDSSKVILLYAFNILHSRAYVELKDIFIGHKSDSSNVWQASGCTGVVWKVNSYMLHLLNPQINKRSTSYLTEREYQDYFQVIGY